MDQEAPKPDVSSEAAGSFWVLESADRLLQEVSAALWLLVASHWRVPLAAVRSDSFARLQQLGAARRVLPARLTAIAAALASSLLLTSLLPARTMGSDRGELVEQLAAIAEWNWLLLAAPGLLALWSSVALCSGVLRLLARAHSPWARTRETLLQVAAIVTTTSCVGIVAVALTESVVKSWRRGLPDQVVISGFFCMMALLAISGAQVGKQLMQWRQRGVWRLAVIYLLGPLCSVGSLLLALTATYWLVQAQAQGYRFFEASMHRLGGVSGSAASCYIADDGMVCQLWLRSRRPLALAAVENIRLHVKDGDEQCQAHQLQLEAAAADVVQIAPRIEPNELWMLDGKTQTAFAFKVASSKACRLLDPVAFAAPGCRPASDRPYSQELDLSVSWRPSYMTTQVVVDVWFLADLEKLCSGKRAH